MIVSAIMTQPVHRIHEHASVQQAVETMSRHHIGSLIVTQGEKDVGIITERDVLSKVIAHQLPTELLEVKDVMSTPLVTTEFTTTGDNAIRLMRAQHVRRLPITENAKIVGMFTPSDVLKLAD
jgi:CBS domain-containing protein